MVDTHHTMNLQPTSGSSAAAWPTDTPHAAAMLVPVGPAENKSIIDAERHELVGVPPPAQRVGPCLNPGHAFRWRHERNTLGTSASAANWPPTPED